MKQKHNKVNEAKTVENIVSWSSDFIYKQKIRIWKMGVKILTMD